MNQRMTWGVVTILVPGLRGGPLHDAGVGDVDDEPDHHGDDDEELAEQQLQGEQGDAAVDVQDGGVDHQLEDRGQDGQLHLDVGGDPPVDVAAQVDCLDQGGEVVVGQDDLGGLLGDFGAAAHGDADVGLLEGGGVVDRVAGHRDDLAVLLHELGQPKLVFRGDPAEDVQPGQPLDHLVIGQVLQLGAGDDAGPEAEFVGDRAGGDGVVAGDHPDVDAGAERGADRVPGLGAQRVHDPDQRDKDQVRDGGHRVCERRGHRRVIQVLDGEREDPQPALGQLAVGGQELARGRCRSAPAGRATGPGRSGPAPRPGRL